ncbi:hypothetical protein CHS0354_002682 [Potamilus streckersoni]|uniref:Uncharacterized protein n=1 Tax=Potamilus streckersoni TaxID=2493646 RepID=A0AAE0RVX3_9BIVA|nr:hypothetical protein CHS0354_002682 [Potamilus streckersoni]
MLHMFVADHATAMWASRLYVLDGDHATDMWASRLYVLDGDHATAMWASRLYFKLEFLTTQIFEAGISSTFYIVKI